jgi:hypothetical protein
MEWFICIILLLLLSKIPVCVQIMEWSEQEIMSRLFEKDATLRQCQVCAIYTNSLILTAMKLYVGQ